MPAWILLPVGSAAAVAVLITWSSGSLLLGLTTALVGALAAAWWCEQMLRGVAGTIAQIAGGDRYAALPERIGSGAMLAQGLSRARFVEPHQPTVAGNIPGENGRKPPLHTMFGHARRFALHAGPGRSLGAAGRGVY